MEDITGYINWKITKNPNLVIFTFYEVRVKCNLYADAANIFLEECQDELENLGYKVYRTGEKYFYQNVSKFVNQNELMVAVK